MIPNPIWEWTKGFVMHHQMISKSAILYLSPFRTNRGRHGPLQPCLCKTLALPTYDCVEARTLTLRHHVPIFFETLKPYIIRFPFNNSQGLRWMRHREHGRPARPHPEFVPVDTAPVLPAGGRETASLPEGTIGVASGGRGRPEGARPDVSLPSPTVGGRLWVNVVDGIVWPSAPAPCPEVRGGMLCDEPGLGKTITVLALLLRTRGLLPGGTVRGGATKASVFATVCFRGGTSMGIRTHRGVGQKSDTLSTPRGHFEWFGPLTSGLSPRRIVFVGCLDYFHPG